LTVAHGVGSAGMTFSPQISYYRDVFGGPKPWRLGLTAGLEFGSNRFHNYYYGVTEPFSNPERAAYQASAGFAGSRFVATLQQETATRRFVVFVRFDDLHGAVFADSPLVGSHQSWTAGLFMTWRVFKSKKMVSYTPPEVFSESK